MQLKSFDKKNWVWNLSYWEKLQLNFHFEKWYFQLKLKFELELYSKNEFLFTIFEIEK